MIETNYTYKCQVVKVVDGDTIDCAVDLGFKITTMQRLRLARINTPELRSPLTAAKEKAIAARDFLAGKVLDKHVLIKTAKTDMYGRYIAEVITVDGENINDLLVSEGHAVVYQAKSVGV